MMTGSQWVGVILVILLVEGVFCLVDGWRGVVGGTLFLAALVAVVGPLTLGIGLIIGEVAL